MIGFALCSSPEGLALVVTHKSTGALATRQMVGFDSMSMWREGEAPAEPRSTVRARFSPPFPHERGQIRRKDRVFSCSRFGRSRARRVLPPRRPMGRHHEIPDAGNFQGAPRPVVRHRNPTELASVDSVGSWRTQAWPGLVAAVVSHTVGESLRDSNPAGVTGRL